MLFFTKPKEFNKEKEYRFTFTGPARPLTEAGEITEKK